MGIEERLTDIETVLALTCANDYSGSGGCASNTAPAGDCETLG